jgi:hypothetical protein
VTDPQAGEVAQHNAACLVWFMLGRPFEVPGHLIYNNVNVWRDKGQLPVDRPRRGLLSSHVGPTHGIAGIPDGSEVLTLDVIEASSSGPVAFMFRDEIYWMPRDYSLVYMNAILERYDLPRITSYMLDVGAKHALTFEWRGEVLSKRRAVPLVPPIFVRMWRVKNQNSLQE